MRLCFARALVVSVLVLTGVNVEAQPAASVAGRLFNSLSGDAISGATVVIEELRRQTTSAPDGSFSFVGVPRGNYHLMVKADGYSSRRSEIAVVDVPLPVTLQV